MTTGGNIGNSGNNRHHGKIIVVTDVTVVPSLGV